MAKQMPMRGGRGGMKGGPRPKAKKGTLKRLLSLLFKTNGKLLCVVTHYSENDRTKPKRVKLDFGRAAKFEAWLVDEDNDAKKIRVTKNLEFDMKVHSYILLKEI